MSLFQSDSSPLQPVSLIILISDFDFLQIDLSAVVLNLAMAVAYLSFLYPKTLQATLIIHMDCHYLIDGLLTEPRFSY